MYLNIVGCSLQTPSDFCGRRNYRRRRPSDHNEMFLIYLISFYQINVSTKSLYFQLFVSNLFGIFLDSGRSLKCDKRVHTNGPLLIDDRRPRSSCSCSSASVQERQENARFESPL